MPRFMSEQEQEHWDYEMGCRSELQNAFALSQMGREPDDSCKIADLTKAGRSVVYRWHTLFCCFTDAILGRHETYIADFATYAEASDYAKTVPGYDDDFDEGGIGISTSERREPVAEIVDWPASDDIPF